MIYLTGPGGIGKTTAAIEIARRLGGTHIPSPTSGILSSLGLKPGYHGATTDQVAEAQQRIFDAIYENVTDFRNGAPRYWVFDRTPLCAYAYTVAELSRKQDAQDMIRRMRISLGTFLSRVQIRGELIIHVNGMVHVETDGKGREKFQAYAQMLSDIIGGVVADMVADGVCERDLVRFVNMRNSDDETLADACMRVIESWR